MEKSELNSAQNWPYVTSYYWERIRYIYIYIYIYACVSVCLCVHRYTVDILQFQILENWISLNIIFRFILSLNVCMSVYICVFYQNWKYHISSTLQERTNIYIYGAEVKISRFRK